MLAHLQIENPAERCLVGTADAVLRVLALPDRLRQRPVGQPSSILVFRLERVGDLLMARPGLRLLRRQFPDARIDLAVGSWNAPLARLFPDINGLHILDLPWIVRGDRPSSPRQVFAYLRRWRGAHYDLGVNCEGDIRSHMLLRASGARWRAGFAQAGGGPLLNVIAPYDPGRHAAWNILSLIALVAGCEVSDSDLEIPPLVLPAEARSAAAGMLGGSDRSQRLIAVHPSGGRQVKQWPPERLAQVAGDLAARTGATLVVTGSQADHAVVGTFRSALRPDVARIDLTGKLDLVHLGAVLQQADLFLGCDSGPMHLAAAVGTPVVAVFGPSSPVRWGPWGTRAAAVRVDLPCSPCNRIRQPPLRCRGRVPECLEAVSADTVVSAALRLLAAGGPRSADARA